MIDFSCTGKLALVTGGSRGIGRQCALALAQYGAAVAIGYRENAAAAAAVVDEVVRGGGRAVAIRSDVATADGCAELHAQTVAQLGPPDILINSAGRYDNEVFMLMTDAQFQGLYDEHVMSVVRLSRLCGGHMLAKRWGRIINFSSVGARKPGVGQANYAMAKGAVESLTIAMAVEFARRGVTVNCVSPGLVETDMLVGYDRPPAIARQLIKRVALPDEIAAWVLLFVSRYGEMMTAQVVGVDGGYRLG